MTEAAEVLLRELVAEVKALRVDLAGRRQTARLTRADRLLLASILPVVVGRLGSACWTCAEVFALAESDGAGALRGLLADHTAMRFGKLLARAAGVAIDGHRVDRIGDTHRDGALWRILADLRLSR